MYKDDPPQFPIMESFAHFFEEVKIQTGCAEMCCYITEDPETHTHTKTLCSSTCGENKTKV